MSAGFLILPDGRCFSKKDWIHDMVLHAVADQLSKEPLGQELQKWILEQLPGPNDTLYLGFGAWLRTSDNETILRSIDLRQMTVENQHLFCEAAKRSAKVDYSEDWIRQCLSIETDQDWVNEIVNDWKKDNWLKELLSDLADMIDRCKRGELPESKSDCDFMPPEDEKIGPGWNKNP
jgi:hypothetical protein